VIKVICVAGARPNFVKVAPLWHALSASPRYQPYFVHTGQHYDDKMSQVFLQQLGLPRPDYMLDVGSGSHAQQTALLIQRFESVLAHVQPHVVIVVGDVNSTMACALVAAKFQLRDQFSFALDAQPRQRPVIAHVEAGLRSGDNDMPEEINRRVTDAIADLHFTTEASAGVHLHNEGVAEQRVHFVGNVMIDSLMTVASQSVDTMQTLNTAQRFALVTLHRPSNVDEPARLQSLLQAIADATNGMAVVFPAHPRTAANLAASTIMQAKDFAAWQVVEPLGYTEFIHLLGRAAIVCTDSGGIQEEATILGTPCVTLRTTTERPITVTHGTNRLAGVEIDGIVATIRDVLESPRVAIAPPPLWDGQTAPRIVGVIEAAVSE
jgi:UDP-N-acetylglucosamine 2-epimerase (non-hydrolysing)